MRFQHDLAGETIGTFILVFFGCGSVAATVLFSSHVGLFQVAAIWGSGVALAIYATRHLSCAHLNPAVSIAMAVGGRMNPEKLPTYLAGQFMGAALAALTLYGLFASAITEFELMHGIVRGTPNSVQTAMIFGEFFPNPGLGQKVSVSLLNAFGAEVVGTFILVFFIMALTEGCNIGRPATWLLAWLPAWQAGAEQPFPSLFTASSPFMSWGRSAVGFSLRWFSPGLYRSLWPTSRKTNAPAPSPDACADCCFFPAGPFARTDIFIVQDALSFYILRQVVCFRASTFSEQGNQCTFS